jgi:hypothetical protein
VAEEVVVEESCFVSIVAAVVVEAVDQAMFHIRMEDHMTGKNYNEKVIVEPAVVEHLDKRMDVVAVAVE